MAWQTEALLCRRAFLPKPALAHFFTLMRGLLRASVNLSPPKIRIVLAIKASLAWGVPGTSVCRLPAEVGQGGCRHG